MLVLSRKKNESIVINGDIRIEVLQIKGKQIRLGITAPSSMRVLRGELPPENAAVESTTSLPAVEKQLPVECNLSSLASALVASA
jgi:carbon storage regulator